MYLSSVGHCRVLGLRYTATVFVFAQALALSRGNWRSPRPALAAHSVAPPLFVGGTIMCGVSLALANPTSARWVDFDLKPLRVRTCPEK